MKLKILARTVTYDSDNKKILLVKNKGADFWYAPGGGWEYERENILECASREVFEETGLRVKIEKFLYAQEFHESTDSIFFETFWLATPTHAQALDANHIDLDKNGIVEEARWFARGELQDLKVFPERLKDTFWDGVHKVLRTQDTFLGMLKDFS